MTEKQLELMESIKDRLWDIAYVVDRGATLDESDISYLEETLSNLGDMHDKHDHYPTYLSQCKDG
jgi:hypothetical protein